MNIFEPIIIGFTQLMANKMRSTLSLIGILIAVGAVTGIVSMGDGLQKVLMVELDQMGITKSIYTWAPEPWYRDESGNWVRRAWEEHLSFRDIDAMMAESDKIEYIVPHVGVNVGNNDSNMRRGKVSTFSSIASSSPEYLLNENWEVGEGRFINNADLRNRSKVCVIGNDIAIDLFGEGVSPLEQEVKIGTERYTVVGLMKPKEFFDSNFDQRTIIPVTTAQLRMRGNDYLDYMIVTVKKAEDIEEVKADMMRVYRRLHGEHGKEFNFQTGAEAIAEINRILFILKAVAGGVAGISLVVGCIGIMNIMLVSVTERKREIGTRKALGATRANILMQFVVEALVLCLFGGFLGLGLGFLLGKGISIYIVSLTAMPFKSYISPELMIFTVGVSLAVGLIAGVYPAWSASRLDPVEALRDE
ncbi:ABC transporter permease [Candidatus Latescibacterota bacterium]